MKRETVNHVSPWNGCSVWVNGKVGVGGESLRLTRPEQQKKPRLIGGVLLKVSKGREKKRAGEDQITCLIECRTKRKMGANGTIKKEPRGAFPLPLRKRIAKKKGERLFSRGLHKRRGTKRKD